MATGGGGCHLLFATSFSRSSNSSTEVDEVSLSHPVRVRAVRVLRQGRSAPPTVLGQPPNTNTGRVDWMGPGGLQLTLGQLRGFAPATPATGEGASFWLELHAKEAGDGGKVRLRTLLPPTKVGDRQPAAGKEEEDVLELPAGCAPCATIVVKGSYAELSLAFYGDIAPVAAEDGTGFPDASRLCPVLRPRPHPTTRDPEAQRPLTSTMPPPLALLVPLAARRLGQHKNNIRYPRSEEYVVPAPAAERVAGAVRACVGAWAEAAERREAAVEGLRAAVEGLWTAWDRGNGGGGGGGEGDVVRLADAVAGWEAEATGDDGASTLLEDLVHCALSLLGYARPDVPSDLTQTADDECQLAMGHGALGLRLAAALCVSPTLAQPFLHAGGGYALQSVLSSPWAPTGQWTVPCLQALWAAIQDPAALGDFVEEGRAADVRPYLVAGGGEGAAEGGPSFYQAVLLLLARRHLSAEATALARRIAVRCALREALVRVARLAGLAAERGLHDFRRGLEGLFEAAEREEEEAAAASAAQAQSQQKKGANGGHAKGTAGASASSSSLPFRLALALGDVRRRLAQDRAVAASSSGSSNENDDDLDPSVLRLLQGYEYPRLLATAAAVALRASPSSDPSPLQHELALSVSALLASYRGDGIGRLLLGDVEALVALGGLLAPSAPLAGEPHEWNGPALALAARVWAREYVLRLLAEDDDDEDDPALSRLEAWRGLASLAGKGEDGEGRASVEQEMVAAGPRILEAAAGGALLAVVVAVPAGGKGGRRGGGKKGKGADTTTEGGSAAAAAAVSHVALLLERLVLGIDDEPSPSPSFLLRCLAPAAASLAAALEQAAAAPGLSPEVARRLARVGGVLAPAVEMGRGGVTAVVALVKKGLLPLAAQGGEGGGIWEQLRLALYILAAACMEDESGAAAASVVDAGGVGLVKEVFALLLEEEGEQEPPPSLESEPQAVVSALQRAVARQQAAWAAQATADGARRRRRRVGVGVALLAVVGALQGKEGKVILSEETALGLLPPALALPARLSEPLPSPSGVTALRARLAAHLRPWLPGGARWRAAVAARGVPTTAAGRVPGMEEGAMIVHVLRDVVCRPLLLGGNPGDVLAGGALLCELLPPPLPAPYGPEGPTEPDAELSSRALWARWLLLPNPDDALDSSSSSSAAAAIATLVLLLAVSGLPAARRLAADIARRVIDVGPGPGRVLVAAVVARVRQWTEEALATQIAAAAAASSSGAAASKPPTDAARALQRLEGLVALLLTVVEDGGPLAHLLLLEEHAYTQGPHHLPSPNSPSTPPSSSSALPILAAPLLLLPNAHAAPSLPRCILRLLALLCDPARLRGDHDLPRPPGLLGRLTLDPRAVGPACQDGALAALRRALPGVAYTVKRTALRWGIHDAALLHPAVSILLSTGQVCGPRAMLAEVVAYVHINSSKKAPSGSGAREREFVFLSSHFYGKALEVLGSELLRLGESLEAKYQLLLDAQQHPNKQQLPPPLRGRAASLARVETDLCQTLHALALLLAAPQITAALCPPGTKRLQRAWFQRESSKTRGQPPPPLPPLKGLALVADGLAAATERVIVLSSALTSAGEDADANAQPLLSLGKAREGIVDAAPLLATARLFAAAETLLAQVESTRAGLDAAAAAQQAAAGGKEEEPPAPPDMVTAYRETDGGTAAGLAAAVDEWAGTQRPVVDLLAAVPVGGDGGGGTPLARLHPVAASMAAGFQWTVGPLPVLAEAAGKVGGGGEGAASGHGGGMVSGGSSSSKRGREAAPVPVASPVEPRANRPRRASAGAVEGDAMGGVEEGGLASPEWGEDEEDSMGVGGEGEGEDEDGTPILGGED